MVIKFRVNNISEVHSKTDYNGMHCVELTVSLDGPHARDLFYQLWSANGDNWLAEIIGREGYELLTKKEPT